MLTEIQQKYLDTLVEHPMITDTAVASMIGVNRNKLREWRNLESFQKEYKARMKETWTDGERSAIETMLSLAREGDFRAAKYILDSLGYAAPTKIEADLGAEINLIIDGNEK